MGLPRPRTSNIRSSIEHHTSSLTFEYSYALNSCSDETYCRASRCIVSSILKRANGICLGVFAINLPKVFLLSFLSFRLGQTGP